MTEIKSISIGDKKIGPDEAVYCVAEMSANHSGSLERAKELVYAAKESGADAVKLQCYRADSLTIDSDKSYFRIHEKHPLWGGRKLFDLYREAAMPWQWHQPLLELCQHLNMECFSTPFDLEGVEFLESIGVNAYKVASFEAIDYDLLKAIGSKSKPVILSTGMCKEDEVEAALKTLKDAGSKDIVLLKCTSAYPATAASMNLNTLKEYTQKWGVLSGLSDHTLGHTVALTAVALGACFIEKHFVLDRSDPSPDASFSMLPHEFKQMVEEVKNAKAALGKVSYGAGESEAGSLCFRRSIFVIQDIKKNEILTRDNIKVIRPGQGLHPKYFEQLLGKRAATDLFKAEPLKAEDYI